MLIAITGGIGCGKSVVSRMLRIMGYPVYDCDTEAKRLMDSDDGIKNAIACQISPKAIDRYGNIDRKLLSDIVFSDKAQIEILNSIVHEAVRQDIANWAKLYAEKQKIFVETAILYQSGLDKMVDKVIEVTATEETRILRVCRRNSLSEAEVVKRIYSQRYDVRYPHPVVTLIDNSGAEPVLPQLLEFLSKAK